MSVAWTQNGDGQYVVESAQHLLQIMNQGSLGADTGSVPANFWSASYLQTQDIDLVNDHANILPIGTSASKFTGQYDGGLFEISNWSFSSWEYYAGLFGYTNGATLRKLRLGGVWEHMGINWYSGFICGYLDNSAVYDVEGDFGDGTAFGDRSTDQGGGTLFGYIYKSNVQGATVRGSVHFATNTSGTLRGGIAGQVDQGSHTLWRNLATFPNGIGGGYAGGFIGEGVGFSLANSQNTMVGDIVGTSAGGIVGYIDKTSARGSSVDTTVNSMTGNITGTTGGAGGIIGETDAGFADFYHDVYVTKVLNYMRGDVTGASGAGGIVGTIGGQAPFVFSVTGSIVAPQGTVDQSVRGSESLTPQMDVYVDTSFGLVSAGNDHGSATVVEDAALVYHSDFADLPYIDMSGTDAEGTAYDLDFVFANIGGKTPEYTHLSVHKGQVSAPYSTDFGIADGNTTFYLTYANTDTDTLHHLDSLTIVQTLATNIGVIVVPATKDEFFVAGDDVYDITEAGTEVAAAVNELFATGDRVALAVNNSTTKTTFVNRGDQIDIAGANAILLPFDPDVAEHQDATITLSDTTSVAIDFDQASGSIEVGGTTYGHGDYFVLDGQKVSVFDI